MAWDMGFHYNLEQLQSKLTT